VYLGIRKLEPYVAAATEIGFSILPDHATTIAGEMYASAVLEMVQHLSMDGSND
jgi:hypothetical protein